MGFLDEAIKWLKDIWDKDSNKILTAATVMGVGVVAVESFKAGERCEQKRPLIEAEIKEKEEKLGKSLTKIEKTTVKAKYFAPELVPPMIFGTLEIFGIKMNNNIAMGKIAGLSYILNRKELENKTLKEEMHKVLSEKEANKVEEKVIQKQGENGKISEKGLKEYNEFQAGNPNNAKFQQLYYEPATNQFFFSTDDEIKKACDKVDKDIYQGQEWCNVNSWLWYINNADHGLSSGECQGYTQKRNGKDGINLDLTKYIQAPNGLPAKVINTDYGPARYAEEYCDSSYNDSPGHRW